MKADETETPLHTAFGRGLLVAVLEVLLGVMASIFDGFLPYGGLLIVVGVGFLVPVIVGEGRSKRGAAETAGPS
ncbi:hypothetical protein [Actinoallomurus iriomotensis]|uniref:Uncharacterized protein n=1 Tax=Actinoallomurus iriomotensis TaxID=478107 RepID=A0A9W6RD07_9ACTN|nr:hypothetical protein [Actinoallomurus iriomotensis]GLY73741.1 hypothetical protein Airi01_020080 [Actinoallomurus iriomotensis]